MKVMLKRILEKLRRGRGESWGKSQIREMAKLGGKLVVMYVKSEDCPDARCARSGLCK